jgi:peptide/nickel transport system permease protein
MAGSIPASATADLAPAGPAAPGVGGMHLAARVVRTPTGALGLGVTALLALLAIVGPALAPADPALVVGPSLAPPSAAHWLGTDALGRDVLSGVLHGARTSLVVAALVGLIAMAVGLVIGTFSATAGGRVDDLLMRFTEFFQVVPRFFLAVLALALFGPGLDRLVLVLGLTSPSGSTTSCARRRRRARHGSR